MRRRIVLLSLLIAMTPFTGFSKSLPVTELFQLRTERVDPNTFNLVWQIKKGYFLYQKRIEIQSDDESQFTIGPIRFPASQQKRNRQGTVDLIYRTRLILPISVLGEQPGESIVRVHYQGCSDSGICYPPQTSLIKIAIDEQLGIRDVVVEPNDKNPSAAVKSDKFSQLFSTHNWFIIALSFFGFGILLALTPCVWPMIPVLSGIIVGNNKTLSTSNAFFLSLSYVLGMSLTYSAIGAVFAVMGNNLQVAMQSPWIISVFSLLFVILALSMFDLYEFRWPSSWNSKITQLTQIQMGGRYLNALLMGSLSSLILSPCVTAPLLGALTYMAKTGEIVLGGLALFFVGLGMGAPLLLIGSSFGHVLPKAGAWMNTIKQCFGIILLGIAIYLVERIIPVAWSMILWAGLTIGSAVYWGNLFKCTPHKPNRYMQVIAWCVAIYGIIILIGGIQGSSSPLKPFAHLNKTYAKASLVVTTLAEAQQAITQAKGTPVVIDFYADWCATCKVLEETSLQDPRVGAALQPFRVIKIDLSDNTPEVNKLLAYFQVVAPPTFLFINQSGHEINGLRLTGDFSTQELLTNIASLNIRRAT